MRNCGKIKQKKTKLDRMMDRLVIVVSVAQTPPAPSTSLLGWLPSALVRGCLLGSR